MLPGEAITLTGIGILVVLLLRWQKRSSLPPGPKGLPIVGNLFDLPPVRPWEAYREWAKQYGDVIFLDLPMQPTVVLGSTKAALNLLDKRSHIYSARMSSVMIDLMAWSYSFGLMTYGPRWRAHRKLFHQHFNRTVVHRHLPVQTEAIRGFLERLLSSPEDLEQHIRYTFSSLILQIVYGVEITDIYDEYISLTKVAFEGVSLALTPGRFWVEFFPFLRNLPNWFPATSFRRIADYYRPIVEAIVNRPFDVVKEAQSKGTASPSIAHTIIQDLENREAGKETLPFDEQTARNVTGIAFSAGTDTTVSAAMSFFVAMVNYPNVQETAQAYIDLHIGRDRLPDCTDLKRLPYIQAMVMETMRWMPVTPMGLPHVLQVDDEYEGHFLPKGTMVLPNAWGMLHNPDDYPEPERFRPERFLNEDGSLNSKVPDPNVIAFGFGRRICPGRHLSNTSLFLLIASTLQLFRVEPRKDKEGNPLNTNVRMSDSPISMPESVPCVVVPRWNGVEGLVRNNA